MHSHKPGPLLWLIVIGMAIAAVLLVGCPRSSSQTASTAQAPSALPPPPPPPPAEPAYGTSAATETAVTPQTAADPDKMTELEQKHVPQFTVPATITSGTPLAVTVNVGKVPHPMTEKHYIQWIELFVDGKSVKKVDLKPGDKPEAKFEVTLTAGPHTLKSDINCNIHGLWENTKDITAS